MRGGGGEEEGAGDGGGYGGDSLKRSNCDLLLQTHFALWSSRLFIYPQTNAHDAKVQVRTAGAGPHRWSKVETGCIHVPARIEDATPA